MDINIPLIMTDMDLQNIIDKSVMDILNIENPDITPLNEEGNKLSNIYVVENNYILKIVTRRHVEYHRLLTFLWNTSLTYTDSKHFFKSFNHPYDMVKHEYEIMNKMNETKIHSPKPIGYGQYEDCGVIIIEYIPNAVQFGEINENNGRKMTNKLYESVLNLHQKGIPHGDLQPDNILVSEDKLYIIDFNNLDSRYIDSQYYDIASVIATASSIIGPQESVNIAMKYFSEKDIKKCIKFIPVVTMQFGHDANKNEIKNAINNI